MTTTTETRAAGIDRVRKVLERDFREVRMLESRHDPNAPFRAVFCLSPRGAERYLMVTYSDVSHTVGNVEMRMHDVRGNVVRVAQGREHHIRPRLARMIQNTDAPPAVLATLRRDLRDDSTIIAGQQDPLQSFTAGHDFGTMPSDPLEPYRIYEQTRAAAAELCAKAKAVADARRREEAIVRALWPDVTDAERTKLAARLSDDIRAGKVTFADMLARFPPDRIKAAEEANTIKAVRWSLPDAGDVERDRQLSDWCDFGTRVVGRVWSAYHAPLPSNGQSGELVGRASRSLVPIVTRRGTARPSLPTPDADAVPDLGVPSTMGELRKAGARPLCTADEGPRYDFDEVP